MRLLLLVLLSAGVTNSLVEFTNSAIYDIYDFKSLEEVHIAKCDYGCLIFAATMGESFVQEPDGLDPYATSIHIVDNDAGTRISVPKLAQQRDKYNRKIPLTIIGQGNISVVNENVAEDWWVAATIVIYVVEKTKAEEFSSYEVYDYWYIQNAKVVPQSDIVTIMSAWNFRLRADPTSQPNSVTARLVGFDNALDNNKDGCPYAYKTPASVLFPGFTLILTAQIVSLVIENKNNAIEIMPDLQYNSVRDFVPDGFIASPGWNGCTKPNNGGLQYFRFKEQLTTDTYLLINNNDDYFNVAMDVLPNFDAKHYLGINQVGAVDKPTIVKGTTLQTYAFTSTNYLTVSFQDMKGDQGFLLRYASILIPKSTTIGPSTETTPISIVTTPTLTTTTSTGIRAIGSSFALLLIVLLQ